MNPLAQLDQLNLSASVKTDVTALIQSLMAQAAETIANQQVLLQSKDSELLAKDHVIQIKNQAIEAKDFKIAALTHELAYYKRIRYNPKNEALAPWQRDVFEETWHTDISAIEAEVEQLADDRPCETVARPKRPRAGRQPFPDHLPRIYPQGTRNTVTNRNRAPADNAARTWSRSAKMCQSNWMLSLPSFLCIAISARNTPAEAAKRSRQPRFHLP